ncbi:MAG TPA: hypothetical protein VGX48_12240 [Pyrinomonadaceae bacterium]|jgi:hypothetical protein|nr:hypothetical protein [Pyrinomonadaceae bacterium]
MAKGALFVGWGPLIPGREEAARKVLGDAMQYLQRLQREGEIDGFEAVALEPHGGDLNGFVLVKGEKEAISRLRASGEFTRVAVRVQLVHSHVGVVGAYTGAEMQSLFETWDSEEDELI